MNTEKHYSWQDGLPTKPDVDMLLKQWPEMKEGDRFTYQEVADVLRVAVDTNRFRTVTYSWRKRLLEKGVVVECETGEAFYVATSDQISSRTYSTLKFIGRKAKRHRTKLGATRPKDETQRGIIEHQARLMLAVEKDTKKARMNLLPATAAPEPPRIGPPAKKASGEE